MHWIYMYMVNANEIRGCCDENQHNQTQIYSIQKIYRTQISEQPHWILKWQIILWKTQFSFITHFHLMDTCMDSCAFYATHTCADLLLRINVKPTSSSEWWIEVKSLVNEFSMWHGKMKLCWLCMYNDIKSRSWYVPEIIWWFWLATNSKKKYLC